MPWFICRPITIRKLTCAIQFSICNMAPARTRPVGCVRANANFILDNLIAAKSCKPMIVVMAYGYARRVGEAPVDLFAKGFGSPEMLKAMQDMAAAFEDDVTQAVIPYIDST